jgi:hypothetical protein
VSRGTHPGARNKAAILRSRYATPVARSSCPTSSTTTCSTARVRTSIAAAAAAAPHLVDAEACYRGGVMLVESVIKALHNAPQLRHTHALSAGAHGAETRALTLVSRCSTVCAGCLTC